MRCCVDESVRMMFALMCKGQVRLCYLISRLVVQFRFGRKILYCGCGQWISTHVS